MTTMHLPAQYLWFDTEEWLVLFIPFVMGIMGHAVLLLLMPLLPYFVFPLTRKQPRGFVMHLKLTFGLSSLHGYPPNIYTQFEE